MMISKQSHLFQYDIPKRRYWLFSTVCYSGHNVLCAWATFWFCLSPWHSKNLSKLVFNLGTHLLKYGIQEILVSNFTSLIMITAVFIIIRTYLWGIRAQGIMVFGNTWPLFVFMNIIVLDLIPRGMDRYIIVILTLGPFLTIFTQISFINFLESLLSLLLVPAWLGSLDCCLNCAINDFIPSNVFI